MNDINSVILVGRLVRDLGSDPNGKDYQYTQGGMCIGRISIAVNKSKKQADGSYTSEGDFYDVTLFGKLAENLKQYLTKGKQIVVQGHLNQDKWVDQQSGQNRSKISIIADNIQLVGGQSQNGNGQAQPQGFTQQQYPQAVSPNAQYQQQQSATQQFAQPQNQYGQTPQPYQQNPYAQQPQTYPQPQAEGFPEEIPF